MSNSYLCCYRRHQLLPYQVHHLSFANKLSFAGLASNNPSHFFLFFLTGRISAGFDTFYGVANNGTLYYWGVNPQNTAKTVLAPTPFTLAPAAATANQTTSQLWSQVGSGVRFGCGIPQNGGKPQCWGGAEEDAVKAVKNVTQDLVQLCVGTYHACGVSTTGSIVCWGGSAKSNALGNGNNDTSIFNAVVNGTDWASVSCGNGFTFGLKKDGSLVGWGENGNHQVSPSNDTVILTPYQVPGTWLSVSAGTYYTLAIDSTNAAYGWGLSEKIDVDFAEGGSLGDGSKMCYDPETKQLCDRKTTDPTNPDGEYSDYGYNFYSKTEAEPVPVTGGMKFSSIAAGNALSCGVEQTTNAAYCWGYAIGEASVEGSPQTNAPKLVDNSTWASITVGSSDTRCGTKVDGSLWCWGRNNFNCESDCPLGDGTANNSPVPVKVINVASWLPDAPSPVPAPLPAPVPAPAPVPTPTPAPAPGGGVSPQNIPSPPPPAAPVSSAIRSSSGVIAAGVAVIVLALF
jgi:alpha-tubulin suppressor-like RCC1 family protein